MTSDNSKIMIGMSCNLTHPVFDDAHSFNVKINLGHNA